LNGMAFMPIDPSQAIFYSINVNRATVALGSIESKSLVSIIGDNLHEV